MLDEGHEAHAACAAGTRDEVFSPGTGHELERGDSDSDQRKGRGQHGTADGALTDATSLCAVRALNGAAMIPNAILVEVSLEPYIDAWRVRFGDDERALRAREERARALLPALVQHLVERYGVRRVWLFGSLAEASFGIGSDIDLAAEGLPPGQALFRAGAELDDIGRPFRVDLVPIEDAREPVRAKIVASGELLHDGR